MNAGWITDIGCVRTNNEDNILIDEKQGIFLLADGMGGHNAGEVASDIAVKEAYAFILDRLGRTGREEDPLEILEAALQHAHAAVRAKALSDSSLNGMGTTLIELYIRGDAAYLCHAGDSRGYLLRGGLERITRDHTVGDSYVASGQMETQKVPPRMWHILTQAVGTSESPVPDKKMLELQPGDLLLLCSDGLTDMLSDADIEALVIGHRSMLSEMARALAEAAKKKGGKDNISLIAVRR
ncbi:MAG: serine/threonine-protein phosphatase [Nitrospirae bacterium]|nr:MAG: serine/threonine-protein phosphatase [Nitrospirota bacterium]